jgi:lipoate-protein ligase A
VRLLTGGPLDDAPLEAAISHALLDRVGAGELPETLRIAATPAMVSFGRLDTHAAGFADAVRAAQAHGFAAVHRLAGGRAAAFHPQTLVFAWVTAEPEPQAGTHVRFARLAGLVADALDLQVGAIEGEYCPGDYSLHAGGVKVGGISQRVTKSASATEGMVVVEGGQRIRDVLVAVNAALGVDWDPATAGDLAGASLEDARDAFLARVARDRPLEPAELDPDTLALARRYATRHDAGDGRPPKRLLSAPVAGGGG